MFTIQYDPKEFKELKEKVSGLEKLLQRDTVRKSINDVARETHEKIIRDMPNYVDIPKPITLKSLYVQFASGNRLAAFIEFKAYAGKKIYSQHWLAPLVFGIERRDKGLEIALRSFGLLAPGYKAVPTKDVRTDGFGNVPGGYVTSIISYLRIDLSSTQNRPRGNLSARQWQTQVRKQKRFFVVPVGTKNSLSPGIYEYRAAFGGKAVRKVFSFSRVGPYKARFPFFQLTQDFASARFIQRFRERLDAALKGRG